MAYGNYDCDDYDFLIFHFLICKDNEKITRSVAIGCIVFVIIIFVLFLCILLTCIARYIC
jgi:hypothetical protein